MQTAARCLYSLKTLRVHGLTGRSLWDVTQATLIARIMYACCYGLRLSNLIKETTYLLTLRYEAGHTKIRRQHGTMAPMAPILLVVGRAKAEL